MARYFGFEPAAEPPYYFIGYYAQDAGRVGTVALELYRRGIPLWYDQGTSAGGKWEKQMIAKIKECREVVIFITKKLIASPEAVVKKQFMIAKKYNRPIQIVMLDTIAFEEVHQELLGWYMDLEEYQYISVPHNASPKATADILDDKIHFITAEPIQRTPTEKIKAFVKRYRAALGVCAAVAVTAAAVWLGSLYLTKKAEDMPLESVSETDNAISEEDERLNQFIASYHLEDYDDAALYTYTESETTVTITGMQDKAAVAINIPPVINQKLVTAIGADSFCEYTSLETATIPDTVETIEKDAFYHCTALKSVTIPDSVTSIGEYAFDNCTALKSIELPDSIVSIEQFAFSNCSELRAVTIPKGVTTISNGAFSKCILLRSVTLHDEVTTIDDYAFLGCTSLNSITIPESVTSIGNGVFSGIYSITLHGKSGSYAETYAKDYKMTFEAE